MPVGMVGNRRPEGPYRFFRMVAAVTITVQKYKENRRNLLLWTDYLLSDCLLVLFGQDFGLLDGPSAVRLAYPASPLPLSYTVRGLYRVS